jgi:hypothetical protein
MRKKPTLQIQFCGGRWRSICQCDDAERLARHGLVLTKESGKARVILAPVNPKRVVENRRGVLRQVGVTQWK